MHVSEEASMERSSDDGDEYFDSYGDLSVHALMLNDAPRVKAYRDAFKQNGGALDGKYVMDVGAGTGVLSIMAAKDGRAAKVVAIEANASVASIASSVVRCNDCSGSITVLPCRVEDVEKHLISQEERIVDAIISEWMGFYLIHESMLTSFCYARDAFLRKDGKGLLFPNTARICVAACDLSDYWKTEYRWSDRQHNEAGIDLSCVADAIREKQCAEPLVIQLQEDWIWKSSITELLSIDLQTCSPDDLAAFQASFVLHLSAYEAQHVEDMQVGGIAIWFDVGFPKSPESQEKEVVLDTSPSAPPTHWKQTVIALPTSLDAGAMLKDSLTALHVHCILRFTQAQDNSRQYKLDFEVEDVLPIAKVQQGHQQ